MSNIFIYSKYEFESLTEENLKGCAIIRMHNKNDIGWQGHETFECAKQLYFDDIGLSQLTSWEKFKLIFQSETIYFNNSYAKDLYHFINKNRDKNFVIHCEYGRSRSVATGLFIEKYFNGKIINKKPEEMKNFNTLVFKLLEKQQFKNN